MAEENRWLQSARDLLSNRQFAAAVEAAQKAERAGAPRAECLRVMARAYLQLGRQREAQRALSDLVAADPQDVWALKTLAEVHLAAGRPAKALALLEQAAAISPDDTEIQTRLADLRQAAAAAAMATASAPRPRNTLLIVAVAAVVDLLLIGAAAAWILLRSGALHHRVAQHTPPAAAQSQALPRISPPANPAGPLTQSAPPLRPGRQILQVQPPQTPAKPLTQAQLPRQPARSMTEVQPRQVPARPLQQVKPRQKPHLRILWLRCVPVPSKTVRDMGKVRRVFIMYGELLNDSDVACEVAVIRGRLLAHGQAAGYGLGEVGKIPPHGRVRFSFYAYQLADEGAPMPDDCDAIVIPGFGLSKMLEQFGFGPEIEEMLRSGEVPEF